MYPFVGITDLDIKLMIDDYQRATQNDDPWSPGTDPEAVKAPEGVKPPMPTAGALLMPTIASDFCPYPMLSRTASIVSSIGGKFKQALMIIITTVSDML